MGLIMMMVMMMMPNVLLSRRVVGLSNHGPCTLRLSCFQLRPRKSASTP